MADDDNKILETENVSEIDDKEKLAAFGIKILLLYWKRLAVLIGIIGVVVLLFSGYNCSYKSFTCSKTQTTIPHK